MADDAPQSPEEPVDFWTVLEDANATVAQWPEWQQQYQADVFYEEAAPKISRDFES